jgi:hypothetical protein
MPQQQQRQSAPQPPIELTYEGVKVLLHEQGCTCRELDHSKFGFGQDGKTVQLSTYDEDADRGFTQMWIRGAKWSLREALDALLKRSNNRNRIA